eukprot:CAMPEP_0118949588 /NCGR_PEP_ID=MMETSP1169-20130426/49920_1 /TAXON_ID=36882 /ORGANISM="Pyramimonas obovata, Strain CCMP722" /LENGTH=430 /DNA_ID=CAMNT_0006896263 /DNA_START=182 /DNA_END=1474 /DNA_ORIENTATION=-
MQDGEEEWLPTIRTQMTPYEQSVMREVTPLSTNTLDEFAGALQRAHEFHKESGNFTGREAMSCALRAVYLVSGSVYYNSSGLDSCKETSRLLAFDKHLRSVVAHARDKQINLPDAVFMISTSADGVKDNLDIEPPPGEWVIDRVPVFVMAKRNPAHPGLLMPSPNLGDITRSWAANVATTLEVQKQRPWKKRASVAFWRGPPGKDPLIAQPRLQVALLSAQRPAAIDAAFTESISFPLAATNLSGAEMMNLYKLNIRPRPRAHQLALSHNKYLLALPGSATGSFSKALQGMWAQGSVVLMWRNAAVEFYYAKLSAGRTHVAVDAPTLLQRVGWLRTHDEEARGIAAEGVRMFQQFLSPDAITVYWAHLIQEYRRLLVDRDTVEVPADACTCEARPELPRRKCGFCDHWLQESVKSSISSYLFHHGYSTRR